MTDELLQQVLAMLEGRRPTPDDYRERGDLLAALSAAELGQLLPMVWRYDDRALPIGAHRSRALAKSIDELTRPVSIGPEVFSSGIEVLLANSTAPEFAPPVWYADETRTTGRNRRIGDCLWRLIAGLADMPHREALAGLAQLAPLADGGRSQNKARVVVAARLADDPALQRQSIDQLLATVKGDLERDEWAFLLALPPLKLRDWVVAEHGYSFDMEPDDRHAIRMRYLDEFPGYADFARSVFVRAEERLRAIADKRTPYVSDGAFPLGDCAVIERAALWGLSRAESWCLESLGELWRMAAVAPDAKTKSVPSQSLSIRFANASVTEPRPEALRALDAVAVECQHAGVCKKLERARKSARTALAAQPDRLLALDPSLPVPKDMLKPFAAAIEGLLALPEPVLATVWARRLGPGRKEGWALARHLVWEVSPPEGGSFTALAKAEGGWTDLEGTSHAFGEADVVRLWHPVDGPADLARRWRSKLQLEGISQPFLQAGREVYRPEESELSGCRVGQFSGRLVSAAPLVGLARTAGWRSGFESELHLKLGGVRFKFDAGVRVYHGSTGDGTTGALWLVSPQARLRDVPARVVSEALRKVDLLVSVGERGLR
ncbi:DUF4132 domain-containing protein [Tabrizicola sp.]|uniref:DUF4132 domain-containing protein n=1 Tax=Tabrizicola sp. TaxID=2005166 RepID=UPI003F354753